MRIRTGCDIVHIPKFEERSGPVLSKTFTPHELSQNHSMQTLAGFFAAKEAVMKALDLPAGSWQEIEIVKSESGRPEVKLTESDPAIASLDVSISHDGEYAFATAVFLFES